ncbi:uncharacterized protein B0I36DRAFT_360040 [Microdochium trichocladiopsis]|uniref:Heterokaryon incompatibility domain-containing protein n=1 Tax=Microdochium trichocladiopsis TaxID=1682393 RepID=A0A9P8YCR1_9PEZI|nr:uncharacterized protein B0I36DRAFT_360040 [Microdochium trichocladiopsis]KAH7034526.1 hypothetical protein B0I36DRAFT_360040 [Microdochium trichocladiopsis]
MRYLNRPRTLWIDAICMNQKDEDEKGRQIIRMATLYQLAERVVIWLGPAAPPGEHGLSSSTLALSRLEHVGKQVELSRATEVLLANPASAVVVCGHDQILLYHLIRAIVCLLTKEFLPLTFRRLLESIRILAWRHTDFSVPFVLNLLRERQCFLGHDPVYGALGLPPIQFNTLLPQPDYHLPIAQVYQDAFLACTQMEERLTLLMHCELKPPRHRLRSATTSRPPGLPSWVPDCSTPRSTHPISAFISASGISRAWWRHIPSAGTTSHAGDGRPSSSSSPDVLAVSGRHFAVLATVSAPVPADDPTAALKMMRLWDPPNAFDEGGSGVTGSSGSTLERARDTYLETLRVGYLHERWPQPQAETLDEWRATYLRVVYRGSGKGARANPSNHEDDDEDDDDDEAILHGELYWAIKLIQGRSLVTTTDGAIGLAPGWAKPGDMACSILGCKSAILLRAVPPTLPPSQQSSALRTVAATSSLATCQVVGECYIYGMDDSIGLLGPLPAGYTVQVVKGDKGFAQSRFQYRLPSPPCTPPHSPTTTSRRQSHDGSDSDGQQHTTIESRREQKTSSSLEDPRMGPVPCPWSRATAAEDARPTGSPALWEPWRNSVTGELMGSDPRLSPESLRERGVGVEEFYLV